MKCWRQNGVWFDPSCLFVLHVVLISPAFVRTAVFGDYVSRESNDWLADELNLPNDSPLPSSSSSVGNNTDSLKISNNNAPISLQTAGVNTNAIYRSASTRKPVTAILLAENITDKTRILTEGFSETINDVDGNYDAKHYRKSSKHSSTQRRNRTFSGSVSSVQRSGTTKQTIISESPDNSFPVPLQSSGSTKPAFWDYGNNDDVQPADYDYRAVLKDQPDHGCYGFLRLRRNCRSSYYGNVGFVGALAVGFSFILVLLLCACKGCRRDANSFPATTRLNEGDRQSRRTATCHDRTERITWKRGTIPVIPFFSEQFCRSRQM